MRSSLAPRRFQTKRKVKVQYYRMNRLNYKNYQFEYLKKADVKKLYTTKAL